MATRIPKVPRPKIDLDAARNAISTHLGDGIVSGKNTDGNLIPSLRVGRQEIEDAYQDTAAQNSPVRDAPAETGLGEVGFYPVEFDDGSGNGSVSASVGKITPLEFKRSLYGDDRAKQNSKNLFLRNKPGTDPDGIFPIMGPSIKEHFGRPMYVVRTDTPSVSNGHYHPAYSVGWWSKSDDLRRGLVEHELEGHGGSDFSSNIDNSVFQGKRGESADLWGFPKDQKNLDFLRDIIAANTLNASGAGVKKTRLGWLSNKALSADAADELNDQMLRGYHLTPSEMIANSLNWKNQALQVHGEELASGGKSAELGQMKAFLEAPTPTSPKFQAGPRAGLDADNFTFLDIQQKSIYRFLQSTNPAKAEQYLKLLYRLGAVAAPVALPLLDENSDTGRD